MFNRTWAGERTFSFYSCLIGTCDGLAAFYYNVSSVIKDSVLESSFTLVEVLLIDSISLSCMMRKL